MTETILGNRTDFQQIHAHPCAADTALVGVANPTLQDFCGDVSDRRPRDPDDDRPQGTFHSVHVEAAARIARAARRARTKRFVHLSGIGADAGSPSPYIRSRGRPGGRRAADITAMTEFGPQAVFGEHS
jgi:hypothetical protein